MKMVCILNEREIQEVIAKKYRVMWEDVVLYNGDTSPIKCIINRTKVSIMRKWIELEEKDLKEIISAAYGVPKNAISFGRVTSDRNGVNFNCTIETNNLEGFDPPRLT